MTEKENDPLGEVGHRSERGTGKLIKSCEDSDYWPRSALIMA
jgi:hypothetical protein